MNIPPDAKGRYCMKTNYNKFPCVHIKGHAGAAVEGYAAVIDRLRGEIITSGERYILMIDCYPGADVEEIRTQLIDPLAPDMCIYTDYEVLQTAQQITNRVKDRLTDDRVFGQMCLENYQDLVDEAKLANVREKLEKAEGLVVIYGVGARLVAKPDLYVYADMARWELQCRFRKSKQPEWKCSEYTNDNLKKFKWGYFFAWRIADRHKVRYFDQIDYLLDTNKPGMPKLLSGDALREGIHQTVHQPFRVVPFFDPGVWGGKWMEEVCDLEPTDNNYAWCFDCVPEENSLLLECDQIVVEIPSINVVLTHPCELLGEKVFARFGPEFPIRFDFLDTMGGQNLSLQVHPLVGYAQEKFGMHYTQEESYYMLDTDPDADTGVYLGVKTGVKKDELLAALTHSQETGERFEDEKFINRIPVKKHDHVLIPPGTIHCSGSNTMVLEISATPYIFTFKLWDWGRLGLDGRPRPVHIEHGQHVIRFERDTEFVHRELVNNIQELVNEPGHISEKTGLHELEFILTEREWFDTPVHCKTRGSVNVLNLVEGESITVTSPTGAFEPFEVHYAETFIIPEQLGEYVLCPAGEREKSPEAKKNYGVLIARVRV